MFNTQGDVFGSGSAKHLHSQEANDKTIFFKNQMGSNLDAYRANMLSSSKNMMFVEI
jgi:hypothetical protein